MKKFTTLIVVIILTACNGNKEKPTEFNVTTATSVNDTSSFVNVGATNNLALQVFTINNAKDTVLTGAGGTKLRIVKNSLVNISKEVVTGNITIELKEALTIVDIVLANLITTSNGSVLESGGMVYVNARRGVEQLYIADTKAIEIAIPKPKKIKGMEVFSAEIDTATGIINWVNPQDILVKAKDKPKPAIKNAKVEEFIASDIALGIDPAPIKPQKAMAGDDNIISIKFDDIALFPEFKQYQGVEFRVTSDSNYSPADADREWDSVHIKKTDTEGLYTVTFRAGKGESRIEKTYKVIPVYKGNDYALAIADYKKKYDEYKKQQLTKEQQMRKSQEAVVLNNGSPNYFCDPSVNYVYRIKNLGWANIDCFYHDPNLKETEFITTIQHTETLGIIYVSMAFKSRNICIPAHKTEDGTFSFSLNNSGKTTLPIGETVTIVATSYANGKAYYALQQIVVSKKQTVDLKLQETTIEKIKEELEAKI